MEGVGAFVLKLAMFNRRILTEHELADCVRKIRRGGRADITFKHRQPAVFARVDQIAGMHCGAWLCGGRNKQQMDRLDHRYPGGNLEVSAIDKKGGVERDERIAILSYR